MNTEQSRYFPHINESTCRFRHPSGLEVHLTPKDFSVTYVALGVGMGSFDTVLPNAIPVLPSGIAHFLEHKMFDMPDGSDAFDLFAQIGANANAFTTNEYTAYVFSCTDHFEEAFEALLQFITTPHFTKDTLKKETGIIAQEIASYEDDPAITLYMQTMRRLYPNHPISLDVCGTKKSIGTITPEMLQAVYHYYYKPTNMVLSIAGRYDIDKIVEMLDKAFPSVSSNTVIRSRPVPETASVLPCFTCKRDIARPRFMLAYRDHVDQTFEMDDFHGYVMELICASLFTQTGELYRSLYMHKLVGRDFNGSYEWSWGTGHLMITAESDCPENTIAEIQQYLDNISKHMPTEADFNRVRAAVYADTIRIFDTTEDIALSDLEESICGGDFFELPSLIRSISYDAFCQAISTFFKTSQSTYVILKPEE